MPEQFYAACELCQKQVRIAKTPIRLPIGVRSVIPVRIKWKDLSENMYLSKYLDREQTI